MKNLLTQFLLKSASPLSPPTKPLKHLFASHVGSPFLLQNKHFSNPNLFVPLCIHMHRWIMDEWKALEHGTTFLGEIKSAVPSSTPATSPRNNGGEMRAEGWSFLLWQASKQPAGWIAVIGVKCPQLAVHCSLASISSSPLRKEEGGWGTGVVLGRLTHVALTLTAVWRMKRRLPCKIDCHIIIGPHAGQKGVMRLQMEKKRHLLNCAL